MKGKDIIKAIVDANGLDTDYQFDINSAVKTTKKRTTKKKEYQSIDEMIKDKVVRINVDMLNGEVIMDVDNPIVARRFGLSDKYTRYIWDGTSMYFYKNIEEPVSFSISFGGGSTTLVAASVEKYRDTVAKEMVKAVATSGKKYPSWMDWRVAHFYMGKSVLNVFG